MAPSATASAQPSVLTRPAARAPFTALWALLLGLFGVGTGVLAAVVPLAAESSAEAREAGWETGSEDDALCGGPTLRLKRSAAGAGDGNPPAPVRTFDDAAHTAALAALVHDVAPPLLTAVSRSTDGDRACLAHVFLAAIRPRAPTLPA